MPLTEAILTEAADLLRAGMAAKLAALEAEYADGVEIPAPAPISGYWCDVRPPDPGSPADFGPLTQPTICLWPLEAAAGDHALGGEYEVEHSLAVGVVVRGDSQAHSGARQMRYTRAVVELLSVDASLTCGQALYRGTDWRARDLTPQEADYTLQGVVSTFSVITYETP